MAPPLHLVATPTKENTLIHIPSQPPADIGALAWFRKSGAILAMGQNPWYPSEHLAYAFKIDKNRRMLGGFSHPQKRRFTKERCSAASSGSALAPPSVLYPQPWHVEDCLPSDLVEQ